MIYNERELRGQSVRMLAEAVMTAARTAPKAKGRDLVEVAMITDEHIEELSQNMLALSEESGMKFLLRDAANVLQAEAIIVIGVKEKGFPCGLNCGYCGYAACEAKPEATPCAMNSVDVGIAIGAACSKIADLRLDSRVMFSAGWAAKRMNVIPDADLTFAIPLSASSKNPFFDRKSPVKK
ncbi:MAG: ferredoxin [Alistipes sp.]|nr:ferredoxin [Alistipes sp.]